MRAVLLRRAGMTLALFLVAGSAEYDLPFREFELHRRRADGSNFGIAPATGRNIPC